MVAAVLLPSLVIINSAFHWEAFFAYSSVMIYWFRSCSNRFICLSFDEFPPSLLLLFWAWFKYCCQAFFVFNLRKEIFLTFPCLLGGHTPCLFIMSANWLGTKDHVIASIMNAINASILFEL